MPLWMQLLINGGVLRNPADGEEMTSAVAVRAAVTMTMLLTMTIRAKRLIRKKIKMMPMSKKTNSLMVVKTSLPTKKLN